MLEFSHIFYEFKNKKYYPCSVSKIDKSNS